jgi:hypothetical protein
LGGHVGEHRGGISRDFQSLPIEWHCHQPTGPPIQDVSRGDVTRVVAANQRGRFSSAEIVEANLPVVEAALGVDGIEEGLPVGEEVRPPVPQVALGKLGDWLGNPSVRTDPILLSPTFLLFGQENLHHRGAEFHGDSHCSKKQD